MTTTGNQLGWQSLTPPEQPAVPASTQAFTRLARVHAFSAAADALFATALAGSLFFSIPVGEARTKVFAYLAGAMAPFSLLSPLIGPAIDRVAGGRRLMVIVSLALRALFAFILITTFNDVAVFLPMAFGILVLQKGYAVARSALVPSTVRDDDELVRANSKLALISGIVGFVAAGPGFLALKLFGPEGSLVLASAVYVVGLVVSFQLPPAKIATDKASADEKHALHLPTIMLAASGMGLLRGIVGFLSILVAFGLRSGSRPVWEYGVVGAGAVIGSLVGSVVAPKMRNGMREEMILITLLGMVVAVSAFSTFVFDGFVAPLLIASMVGIAAAGGKQAFDAIVQRDAPEANRGRMFARFETRFQIIWVLGAALAIIPMSMTLGYGIVLIVSGFATFTFGVGLLAARQHAGAKPTPATAAAVEVEAKMSALSDAAKRGAGRTWKSIWHREKSDQQPEGFDPPGPTGSAF